MKLLFPLVPIFSAFVAFAQPGEKNFIDQNYIEVTGKSEMLIVPDLIYLKIVLNEKDKNREPIAEVEKKMTDKLRELGIDVSNDLTINDLLSYYNRKIFSKTEVILSKEYRLTVHDAKMAVKVLTELEKLEISNVSIAKLDHTKMEEFKKELKIKAVIAAKEKADYLTKAVNQSIGRALFISEHDNALTSAQIAYAYSNSKTYAYQDLPSYQKETNLDFEKIKLEYSILAKFELK